MLKMYDFHMDFQFPGQKSLPRDLQMDMASPWQLKWASFLAMGLLVQILFSRHSLCIYPYVKTCPFFLRPTFFSKNQPTTIPQMFLTKGSQLCALYQIWNTRRKYLGFICPRVGQNMAKVPKPKTILFHPLLWPKMLCLVWSNWFQPQIWLVPGHSNTQVSQPIWKSLGSYFLSWNWKSMWKSYILNIFCFLKFFGCLWFLGLYLVKNVHFWAIFTKICFCPYHQHKWTKFDQNSI